VNGGTPARQAGSAGLRRCGECGSSGSGGAAALQVAVQQVNPEFEGEMVQCSGSRGGATAAQGKPGTEGSPREKDNEAEAVAGIAGR